MPEERDFYKQIIDNHYDGIIFVNFDRAACQIREIRSSVLYCKLI